MNDETSTRAEVLRGASYTTGSWWAVVTDGVVVVAPSEVGEAVAAELHRAVSAEADGLAAVLDAFGGEFGASIRSFPPFAVVERTPKGARIIVRGDLVVRPGSDGGQDEGADAAPPITGAGVSTWREETVATRSVEIRVPGVEHAPDESPRLPIRDGVVGFSRIQVRLDADAGAMPRSSSAVNAVSAAPAVSAPGASASASPEAPAALADASDSDAAVPRTAADLDATIIPFEETAAADHDEPGSDSAGRSIHAAEGSAAGSPEAAADDDYDHLFGITIARPLEAAAVRDDDVPAATDASLPLRTEPVVPPRPLVGEPAASAVRTDSAADAETRTASETRAASDNDAAPEKLDDDGGAAALPEQSPRPVDETPDAAPAAAPSSAWAGLIAGVPLFPTSSSAAAAPATPAQLPATPAPAPVPATSAPAAPTADDPGPSDEPSPADASAHDDALADDPDHDGETVAVADVTRMRAAAAGDPAGIANPAHEPEHEPDPDARAATRVPAVMCPNGHPSPPHTTVCSRCGEAVAAQAPRSIVRPGLGVAVFSTGQRIALDRPVIVGRRPRASRVSADDMPQLVTVPSPEQDISRSHLELRLEGWHVVAVDLDTTNGSVLHRAVGDPVRLSSGDQQLLVAGDVVDLGDGVTVSFEDLP